MFTNIFLAPAILVSLSKGDSNASLAALSALSSPDAEPEPIIATGFELTELNSIFSEPKSIEIDLEEKQEENKVEEVETQEEELKRPDPEIEFIRRGDILHPVDNLENLDPNDLDVPAYLRNNVDLEDTDNSEARAERIQLTEEIQEEEAPPLSDDNSYLYNNVD